MKKIIYTLALVFLLSLGSDAFAEPPKGKNDSKKKKELTEKKKKEPTPKKIKKPKSKKPKKPIQKKPKKDIPGKKKSIPLDGGLAFFFVTAGVASLSFLRKRDRKS